MKIMYEIAVLIPCYNEEKTIFRVVEDFKRELPLAKIYVYDNNSSDGTAIEAKKAGAIVRQEKLPGKGNVVRRMFADIDANIFVLVDGDCTYKASDVHSMISKLQIEKLDMVVASRVEKDKNSYRLFHKSGNLFFNYLLKKLFSSTFSDVFSGYRVFSKRFVKTFPAISNGFEIETEFTIYSLINKIPYGEIKSDYFDRPNGSFSKLNTIMDGTRILFKILGSFFEERPLIVVVNFSFISFIVLFLLNFLKNDFSFDFLLVWGIFSTLLFVMGYFFKLITKQKYIIHRINYINFYEAKNSFFENRTVSKNKMFHVEHFKKDIRISNFDNR